jgi:hypothetical protein
MAIVVLVLWMFTAGAGFLLLVTSSLGRARPAEAAQPVPVAQAVSGAGNRRQTRRSRDAYVTQSLIASRSAPLLPGLRSLLEFAHPAAAAVGVGFWLGFTLVHYRTLGWVGFGLIALTASLGLTWFLGNVRAARRHDDGQPAPSFAGRLIVLHGAAAAVTLTLAAVTALILR